MKKPELLAPAGNAACALAAFDAGADAIYAGLAKFNARERSENFTPETLGAVIDYAHKLGRKVYVTFNTILKENELSEAVAALAQLQELGPDALIVQDLGVVRILREYFPALKIHASTQMGFHNSAGVNFAAAIGAERVILERQLTLDELREIRKKCAVELEVFVHGALCCSLSGQCLFSSYLGGHSGNRGRCKQPCRRRFFSKDGNGFFFSPQDLCTIDMIPALAEMGVDSLKIEGRLRQPDYVFNTVSAYRMLLDAAPSDDRRKILGEARNLLSKTCGRKWSHGFFSDTDMKQLIVHESLGASGLRCGRVEATDERGFAFRAGRNIHLGDRIRVQGGDGDDGPSLTITKMFVAGENVRKAKTGDPVYICCDKPVPFNGTVYKIGESFSDAAGRVAALKPQREKLELHIEVAPDFIAASVTNAPGTPWRKETAFAAAEKHALSAETVSAEFSTPDAEDFSVGRVEATVAKGLFVPAAVLKTLRREFFDHVKAEFVKGSVFRPGAEGMARFAMDYAKIEAAEVSGKTVETVAVKPDGVLPGNPKARRACSIFDYNKTTEEAILPEFTPEARLVTLERAIARAYADGIRRFRVQSFFELALLRQYADVVIVSADPVIAANSQAVLELRDHGVAQAQAHTELERTAVEALRDKSVLPIELYRFGRIPLLVTRATVPISGDIRDGRSNAFVVRADNRSGLTRVYPSEIFSVPRLPGTLDFYDLRNAAWQDGSEKSTFNYEASLL